MKIVATNGCFDVLHAGHIAFLKAARALGDHLIVGVNSDAAVRKLKGPHRPLQNEDARMFAVAGVRWVDDVHLVDDVRVDQWLDKVKPDIWVKGGDYTLESLNADEVATARKNGTEIKIIPEVFDVHTSDLHRLGR